MPSTATTMMGCHVPSGARYYLQPHKVRVSALGRGRRRHLFRGIRALYFCPSVQTPLPSREKRGGGGGEVTAWSRSRRRCTAGTTTGLDPSASTTARSATLGPARPESRGAQLSQVEMWSLCPHGACNGSDQILPRHIGGSGRLLSRGPTPWIYPGKWPKSSCIQMTLCQTISGDPTGEWQARIPNI